MKQRTNMTANMMKKYMWTYRIYSICHADFSDALSVFRVNPCTA